ncbi:hypothetical protein GC089_17475 [Cellulomonas sp. JZ18]|uniref:hypothetical protein n=1 Tax=Cellulomonas sp. JZ18 TaxID=2654191 RepID=UPI0012D4750A|nr:hypothetical protein [Cellulomonas sp. JZ18]QGQ20651.1 hypothetical protein GC089_17475 [Cellulomonas sp. JZ18]
MDAARADVVAARASLTVLDDVLWTGGAAEGAALRVQDLEVAVRLQLAALDEVDGRARAAQAAAVCVPPVGALPHEGGARW